MSEQQYQCPVCNQQYTQFTAKLHAGCGVVMVSAISEEAEEYKLQLKTRGIGHQRIEIVTSSIADTDINESVIDSSEVDIAPEPISQAQETAPIAAQEPKKRGPKPKAK